MTSARGVPIGSLFRWAVTALAVVVIGLVVIILVPESPISQDAREAVLRTNLATLREGIAEYHKDHGQGPRSLQELVAEGYLPRLPVDPMNGNSATWAVKRTDDGTIIKVRSASEEKTRAGTHYRDW